MASKERLKLRKFIKDLEKLRGRHTELVSVYVPAGYELQKIINHLSEEQGTASNIKDARTRNNVVSSLDRVVRQLRLFKKTPENGLAIFAGNASQQENKVDIQVWSIEPPQPLNIRMYRCDQTFVLDPLKGMLVSKEVYGLIVIDKREATIGMLKGTNIEVITSLTSGVPGKVRAGGQSAQRFSRLREEAAKEFYNRVNDICKQSFLGSKELKGIIIGGPGPTKEEFLDYLQEELKRKIKAMKDITYTDEHGLHDLVEASKDVLAEEAVTKEKEVMQKFFTLLSTNANKVAYGKEEVSKAIEAGAVEILLLSENLDDDISDYEIRGEEIGARVEIISIETREGVQLKDMGGIAAILRYVLK